MTLREVLCKAIEQYKTGKDIKTLWIQRGNFKKLYRLYILDKGGEYVIESMPIECINDTNDDWIVQMEVQYLETIK